MPQIKAKVFGIAGLARSGKDTVADFIIAAVGGYRYSLATPIRAMLVHLGVDLSDPYWQSRKEDPIPALGVSPRRMMQTLGTEWGRELVNKDLWILLAQQQLMREGPGMVVPDVRFNNEAGWVRSVGGLVIHVHRPNAPKVEAHASEARVEVLPGDVQIFNRGSLEELQTTVREVLYVRD